MADLICDNCRQFGACMYPSRTSPARAACESRARIAALEAELAWTQEHLRAVAEAKTLSSAHIRANRGLRNATVLMGEQQRADVAPKEQG